MPKQYACLAEVTVGAGGASTIDFNSIPQTYTDLLVVTSMRGTSTSGPESHFIIAAFNGVTTNRTFVRLEAYGGGVGSDNGTLAGIGVTGGSGGTVSTFNSGYFYVPDYALATKTKVHYADWTSENNSTAAFDLGFITGHWNSTSAITSISLSITSTNIAQYSTATLYGITKS